MQFLTKLSLLAAAATTLLSALALPTDHMLETRKTAKVYSKCTKPKTVALTFDDGPWSYIYDISKALVAAGAKGTFFFNGDNYGCIYDPDNAKRVKYALDKGHQIASHTWAHLNLSTLSWSQVDDEMRRTDEAIQKITGVVPAFMRPPYGELNDIVKNVAGARGQSIALWDFDSEDSIGATPAQSKKLYDSAIKKNPSTILALNHEVFKATAHDVIPYAIKKLQARGYKLVTLAECLGDKAPYQKTGKPSPRDRSWHC